MACATHAAKTEGQVSLLRLGLLPSLPQPLLVTVPWEQFWAAQWPQVEDTIPGHGLDDHVPRSGIPIHSSTSGNSKAGVLEEVTPTLLCLVAPRAWMRPCSHRGLARCRPTVPAPGCHMAGPLCTPTLGLGPVYAQTARLTPRPLAVPSPGIKDVASSPSSSAPAAAAAPAAALVASSSRKSAAPSASGDGSIKRGRPTPSTAGGPSERP